MVVCLAFEGMILAIQGFPFYEHVPRLTFILGLMWPVTVTSCFVFRRWPVFAIAGGVAILVTNSVALWTRDPSTHQFTWFLYMHSVELLFLIAACAGAIVYRRLQTASGVI
jgi:hypothetical protein